MDFFPRQIISVGIYQLSTRLVRGSDHRPAIALSEDKYIFRGITLFEKLMAGNNPEIDLVNDNVYKKMVKFCPFILKILSKN